MISKTIKLILSICIMIGLLSPIPSFALEEEEFSESEDNEVYIIDEDETLRTESSKTFVMSDDSYQKVIYGVPVHFEDDSGEYQVIDNSLVVSADSEDEFVTAASDMKIRFKRKMHESELAGIESDRYRMTWGFADMLNESDAVIESSQTHSDDIVQNALENISGSIRYENVRNHVTLKYGFDSLGVKENIILDDYIEDSTFTFTYNTENLLLEINAEGEIEARDSETDEIIFVMPEPYMYDANEEVSYNVEYAITGEDGIYDITVTADNEWLSDSERAYPVVIDPIIETQTKKSAIDSTFITSWQGTTNHSTKKELVVGTETSEYGYCRTLIKFSLPELKRGDMVTGAELVVAGCRNDFYSSSTPDMQVNANMITSPWDMSTITWNTRPAYDYDTVLDYDYFRRKDVSNSTNWKYFDITKAAKLWYEGTANNGIQLKGNVESTDYAQYGVKSYICPERYNEQENAYPRIVITYRNTKGIESYYDYTSASAFNGDEICINNYNGNPVIVRTDMSAPGGKNPAVLGHVYNGYMADANAGDILPKAGFGWRLNVQQTLRSTTLGEKYPYVYTDGDGTEHYFMKTDTGELRDEDGLGLTLIKSSSGYVIKSASKSQMEFNSLGNLTKMTDENGNDVTLIYKSDNRTVSTISDETGYVITLESYDSGYLKTASDNKGKTVNFHYSQSRLLSITSSDNRENASYTYDSNGNLTKLQSRDQSYLRISYTSAKTGYRVCALEEYGSSGGKGQTIRFDRTKYLLTDITTSGKDSTIGTSDDVITQCQFDSAGRLITCHAKSNGNELGAYSQKLSSSSPDASGSDVKGLNRYEKMANLSPTVYNMLKNHSGESTTGWGHGSSVGNATFTFSSDAGASLFGTKSLKISASQCDVLGRSRFYQNVSSPHIQPNTTYTASAYIRTSGITEVSGQSSGGAAILVYMKAASMPTAADPEAADYVSEYITGTTDVKVNDGWRRVSVTFTTPSDIEYVRFNGVIRGATGTAYFDGLQLEKGSTPSPYNMMENGDMERVSNGMPEGWSTQNLSSSDKAVSTSSRYGTYAFSISPEALKKKEIYQDVSVKGKEGDTYVLSGWSKGTGILERSTQSERKYKISVEIIYTDNTSVWKTPAEFTYAVGEWRYAATSFNLGDGTSDTRVPKAVRVHVRAHGQANTVMFDGIQLVRKDIDQCSYDDNGNLKKSGKTSYTYTGDNLLSTFKDGTGKTLTYQYYTGTSNIYKISDSTSTAIRTFAYDAYGNVTGEARKKSDGTMSIKTETLYDSTGAFVTSTKDENGYESTYANNSRGLVTSYTDAKGTVTQYAYDSYDRITGVSEGNMGHNVSYNDRHLMSSIDTGNTVYSFLYDEFGNMTGVKIGNQNISSNTYAPYNGGLASSSTNNGVTCTYEYDDCGNLIKVKRNGTLVHHIIYSRDGTLLESRDYSSGLATRYRYDFDGNVTGTDVYLTEGSRLSDRWVYGAEVGYDTYGRAVRTSVLTKDASYISDVTYTASGKVASSTYAGKTVQYTYDAIERQTKRRVVISESSQKYLDITYSYRNSDRGTGYTTSQLEAERVGGVRYDYEYDRNGNITSIERSDSESDGTVIYTYDSHDQLIREDNPISGISTSYSYDTNGNLKTKTRNAYVNGVIGEVISTDAYNYGSVISGDRLTKINDEAITYDGIGNPNNMEGWSLAWDGRRLTSMTKGNDTISFGYDSEGRRISKTVNGQTTEYFYIGDSVVGEESALNGKIDYIYDDAGRISALRRTINGTTTTYHLLTNSRGDVEAIYSEDGTLIARYIYDAHGNEIKREYGESESHRAMADINPFRYRGYMYDNETGLYYVSSRYYDPEIGRWINADDSDVLGIEPDSLLHYNLFAYCWNNPVNMTDDNGYLPWFVAAAVGGALFDTAAYLIGSAISGQKITWSGVGKAALTGAVTGVAFGALGKGVKALTTAAKATKVGVKIGTTFGKMGKLVKYRKIAVNWDIVTRHGLKRMSERGMSKSLINSVIKNGKVLQQTTNKFAYISKKGVVIIESNGKIVTAYSNKFFDETIKGYVKQLFG